MIPTIPARETEITRVEAFSDGMLAFADTPGVLRAPARELIEK